MTTLATHHKQTKKQETKHRWRGKKLTHSLLRGQGGSIADDVIHAHAHRECHPLLDLLGFRLTSLVVGGSRSAPPTAGGALVELRARRVDDVMPKLAELSYLRPGDASRDQAGERQIDDTRGLLVLGAHVAVAEVRHKALFFVRLLLLLALVG